MKIQCWSIGKAHEPYVLKGIEEFTHRIGKYFPISWHLIASPKNAPTINVSALKKREGELILQLLQPDDYLILLDEKGQMFTNEKLATYIQQWANESKKKIIFLIGGAYGVDQQVQKRANLIWSLSTLVFPHQLVRLILSEQLYRACTILKNEPYHHS
ncbi:MAG: 23S rRNA (pseudouridine(1915)-N(3))-methyltransferase RlmH [Ferruginibacter sp.]|nr:23S rRNA (pseudouridine(1915)-N(3))-methyltransferase RlmH [Ferruginibacter sp.]